MLDRPHEHSPPVPFTRSKRANLPRGGTRGKCNIHREPTSPTDWGKYVEYAYGEANGAKMYPYPDTLTFYANCYIPGIARQASRR